MKKFLLPIIFAAILLLSCQKGYAQFFFGLHYSSNYVYGNRDEYEDEDGDTGTYCFACGTYHIGIYPCAASVIIYPDPVISFGFVYSPVSFSYWNSPYIVSYREYHEYRVYHHHRKHKHRKNNEGKDGKSHHKDKKDGSRHRDGEDSKKKSRDKKKGSSGIDEDVHKKKDKPHHQQGGQVHKKKDKPHHQQGGQVHKKKQRNKGKPHPQGKRNPKKKDGKKKSTGINEPYPGKMGG